MAQIIDGLAVAKKLRASLATEVQALQAAHNLTPCLAVILVGDDPASTVYVRNKGTACEAAGLRSLTHRLEATTAEETLLALIAQLNNDPDVHGILVQLPLPAHLNEQAVIAALDPAKDVDGFHPENVGRLASGLPGLVPCTPLGSMILIREVLTDLRGQRALVVGRSNIVGKPMASLLLQADCTVTVAHSKTRDLPEECRRADLLIAAIGRPEFIQGDWVKPDAIVIDVGINRIGVTAEGKNKLVGDVAFATAAERARAITPVPGGVGPMTIACLLRNTIQAARYQKGLA